MPLHRAEQITIEIIIMSVLNFKHLDVRLTVKALLHISSLYLYRAQLFHWFIILSLSSVSLLHIFVAASSYLMITGKVVLWIWGMFTSVWQVWFLRHRPCSSWGRFGFGLDVPALLLSVASAFYPLPPSWRPQSVPQFFLPALPGVHQWFLVLVMDADQC